MANNGLKSYCKFLTHSIGSLVKTNININKNDANFHIIIPLIENAGNGPIKTSLIYNHQYKDEKEFFGKGFKLNYFTKIQKYDDKISVFNADGSVDEYLKPDFKNPETQAEVHNFSDEYLLKSGFTIKDKYGNKTIFEEPISINYPSEMVGINGDRLLFDFIDAEKRITNTYGGKIVFKKTGEFISEVAYFQDDKKVYFATLEYENSKLTKVTHKQNNTIISELKIIHLDNQITLYSAISKRGLVYKFADDRVVEFAEVFGDSLTERNKNKIVYEDRKTTIVNLSNPAKPEHSYVFFDDKDFPLFEFDNQMNVVETEYCHETKQLLSKSTPVSVLDQNNNLFKSTVADFAKNGVDIQKVDLKPGFFKNFLKDSVYLAKTTGNGGSLTFNIPVGGIATDEIFVAIWGRQLTPKTDKAKVEVRLTAGGQDSDVFKKEKIDGNFDLMTLGVSATKTFDSIELSVLFAGNASIEIGGIQVFKKAFGAFYAYDKSGNPKDISSGSIGVQVKHNANNFPESVTGPEGAATKYYYNKEGNVALVKYPYGVFLENKYCDFHKSNVLSTTVSSADAKNILKVEKNWTKDGRMLVGEVDELQNKKTFEYDSLGRITKAVNALGVVSLTEYNEDSTIKNFKTALNNLSAHAEYEYNLKQDLTKIKLKNGSEYEFKYDDFDNISEILINQTPMFIYEYSPISNSLLSIKFGTKGDAYLFEYNSDNLLDSLYYQIDNTRSLRFKYQYNEEGQIIAVFDKNNTKIKEFFYDEDGEIIKLQNPSIEINKSYDNLGNVNRKSITVDKHNLNFAYDTVERSKGSYPETIVEAFARERAYIGIFSDDSNLINKKGKLLKSIEHIDEKPIELDTYLEGIIPYVKLDNKKLLSYKLDMPSPFSLENGGIQFWFKQTEYGDYYQCLFSCKDKDAYDSISLYLQYGKITLKVVDFAGKTYDILTSDFSIKEKEWNFVALSFFNRADGQGYSEVSEFAFSLNGHTQVYQQADPRINFDLGADLVYNIGHEYNGKSSYYHFYGQVTCLYIAGKTYIDVPEIKRYYRATKDYLIDNQLVDADTRTVDFSQTTYFNITQKNLKDFEIFPLQNSVTSLTGQKPSRFSLRNISNYDKDRTFNFNNTSKRYAFVADGNELVYDFQTNGTGTIAFRAFSDTNEDMQFLFEAIDEKNQKIALFKNKDSKLVIKYGSETKETNLMFACNSWHFVALSFTEVNEGNGYGFTQSTSFRLIVDESEYIWISSQSGLGNNLKLSVGRKLTSDYSSYNLGYLADCMELQGQIEMLAFRPAFCEKKTLEALKIEIVGISQNKQFDTLGMLKNIVLHKAGQNIMSTTFNYKRRENDHKYISKQISKELHRFKNSREITRAYETDSLGNILSIKDNFFENHSYKYDFRGFLTKDDDKTILYDDNGNILKYGKKTFKYSSQIKDLLVKVDDNEIIYDEQNIFNPKSYKGNQYLFEGRRLVEFTDSDDNTFTYEYDDKGLRIKKITPDETIYYYYDDDKLVSQISDSHRLDFLYDEDNLLYGFILDKTKNYFYLKDSLQNILGIVDEDGTRLVGYESNAYGNTYVYFDNSANSLAEINPFRYKGYYFDKESQMFYCTTRYYVPEWCRWLNIDNPLFIENEYSSTNNLFCYCKNNPVNYIDKDGQLFLSTLIIGAIVGAAIATGYSCYKQNKESGSINWKKALLAGAMGAVSGAAAASGIGLIGSTLISGATSFVESVGNDLIDNGGDFYKVNYISAVISAAEAAATTVTLAGGAYFGKKVFANLKIGVLKNKISSKFYSILTKSAQNKAIGKISAKGVQGRFSLFGKSLTKVFKKVLPGPTARKAVFDSAVDQLLNLLPEFLKSLLWYDFT